MMGHAMSTHTRLQPRLQARFQGGFSFLELAIVMSVVGLMGWAVSAAYGNTDLVQTRDRATQIGESLRSALRSFALTNARLPCPDTDADGWEGGAGGVCAATDQVGWFPYRSLGMDLPDARYRAAYAVYRRVDAAPALDADLTLRTERTSDLPGDAHYQDARDLITALHNASGDVLSTARTRLTGNDGNEGAVDCALNLRSHPAFFLVFPLEDRDANGNRFDGPHDSTVACALSSAAGVAQARDDVVVAEPLAVLAGWLSARAP